MELSGVQVGKGAFDGAAVPVVFLKFQNDTFQNTQKSEILLDTWFKSYLLNKIKLTQYKCWITSHQSATSFTHNPKFQMILWTFWQYLFYFTRERLMFPDW